MNNDTIGITIPNKPDYISMVRLISSAVASKIGFNIDEIEDIKVSIGEACILSFCSTTDEEIEILFSIYKDKLEINLNRKEHGDEEFEESKETKLSKMIIESLMDEAYYSTNEIKMVKLIN